MSGDTAAYTRLLVAVTTRQTYRDENKNPRGFLNDSANPKKVSARRTY